MIFRLFKNKTVQNSTLSCTPSHKGLFFEPSKGSPASGPDWLYRAEEFEGWQAVAALRQFLEEGAALNEGDSVLLPWPSYYDLTQDEDTDHILRLLPLPSHADLTPCLASQGSLSASDFSVYLNWQTIEGKNFNEGSKRQGGVLFDLEMRPLRLSREAWLLAEDHLKFIRREDKSRTPTEKAWGDLRKRATNADAKLDHYLNHTIVLSAHQLDLSLNRVDVAGTQVIEVAPLVEGLSSERWLTHFDKRSKVQDHYDIGLGDGSQVRVIPDEAVKRLLTEIKTSMPGRRISGRRAKIFLRNPYTLLGDGLELVLPPETFEQARDEAGITFYPFRFEPQRSKKGQLTAIELELFPEDYDADVPENLEISSRSELLDFTRMLRKAIDDLTPSIDWKKWELEIRGEAPEQLAHLAGLLSETWAKENKTSDAPTKILVSAEEILDLSRYAERITGIAVYKPIYSPHIKREDVKGSWMPENLHSVSWTAADGQVIDRAFDQENFNELLAKIEQAKTEGQSDVLLDGFPTAMPITDAETLAENFKPVFDATEAGERTGQQNNYEHEHTQPEQLPKKGEKESLLIAENIAGDDYEEDRENLKSFDPSTSTPELPSSLRPEIALKAHQEQGVAWLQHLFRQNDKARGCLLADDMGLGKTLQLLTLAHWYLEQNSTHAPILIVAPVSLLENWRNEVDKFFKPCIARLKMLYGNELKSVKLKAGQIDQQLVEKGITSLMHPEWLGDANIVLTTYDTLRELEFSFAAIRWSIMICDEAQKIKTPNALVTRAAKKQNVAFRIACTGTPVENSLADIWCLFDYVQPGLLGALNEFGKAYRTPIETKTGEQDEALEKLRALVDPQVLRRMKSDVADLPDKIEDADCRSIAISPHQLSLYQQQVKDYETRKASSQASEDGKGGSLVLGMLHHLRMVCSDPVKGENLSLKDYCQRSPKMAWLLKQLEIIRARDEKVIVFTEFRDLQQVLQRYIEQQFNIRISIVNGSTKAQAPKKDQTRQAIIDDFQRTDGFNVIILSTTAVGFGVNIQAANHVVHYTRPWNPAKEDQATDRAYRIGQEKEVTVYYPTIVADGFITFESRLDTLLDSKRKLAGDMLRGSDELSMADWRQLEDTKGEAVLAKDIVTDDFLTRIKPLDFEQLCAAFWKAKGYKIKLTPISGDRGVDIVAIKGNEGVLVQCKTAQDGNKHLNWDAIKEVIAGQAFYEAQYPGITFSKAATTNAHFNKNAREQALLNQVELFERQDIRELLESLNISYLDLEEVTR